MEAAVSGCCSLCPGGGPKAFWKEVSLPKEGESAAWAFTAGTPNTPYSVTENKNKNKIK